MVGGWRERGGAKLWRYAQATHDGEVHGMRRLGRHMGWLGWVVAGVLAVSAGGVALATTGQSTSTSTTQTTVAGRDRHDRAGLPGRWGWRSGRRALHGEVTFQTRDGVRTVVFARGQVTAVSESSVTVTSSDKVATTFALTADTRYGTRRRSQAKGDLKVGVQAGVWGLKSGGGANASRVVIRTGAGDAPKGP
jgi:hypothetical protein